MCVRRREGGPADDGSKEREGAVAACKSSSDVLVTGSKIYGRRVRRRAGRRRPQGQQRRGVGGDGHGEELDRWVQARAVVAGAG